MTHTHRFIGLSAVSLSLAFGALAACSDDEDKAASMSAADYDEVATTMGALVADETRGEPNAYGGAVLLAQGEIPTSFQVTGGIAVGELLGLDYSFSVVCRDGAGDEVDCGDDAVTAHVVVSWSGDWSSDNVVASSDFDGDWTLTGVDEAVIVLDGDADASAEVELTRANGDVRTWSIDYSATYDQVGVDRDSRRAISGTVDYALDIHRAYDGSGDDVSEHFSVDAQASFQADGTAMLVLDGDQVYHMRRNGTVELVARGTIDSH